MHSALCTGVRFDNYTLRLVLFFYLSSLPFDNCKIAAKNFGMITFQTCLSIFVQKKKRQEYLSNTLKKIFAFVLKSGG